MVNMRIGPLLSLLLLLALPLSAEPLRLSIDAESAILMNAETGAILYEKNARARQYPASITKIATALYLLEKKGGEIDSEVEVSQEAVAAISSEAKRKANYRTPSHWLEFGSSHIGLKRGERLSLRTLLYGLMLSSGNDAANAIAEEVSGSVSQFIAELNERLKELGCAETHFTNPHGLHHPDHVTTAYDMAVITREALRHPLFREVVASRSYSKPESNKQAGTTFVQTNRLLKTGDHYYPKAIGVKTGYTELAEATFVGAASDGERTLIAVLLNCNAPKQIFRESRLLFEAAFAQAKVHRPLVQEGEQTFVRTLPGAARPIKTVAHESLALDYYPAEEPQIHGEIAWEPVELPVRAGQKVGEIRVLREEGGLVGSLPLFAKEGVGATFFHRIQSHMGNLTLWGGGAKVVVLLSTLLFLLFLFGKKR